MNDFIGGLLVCSLIVSPFLTYFVLKEIAFRRNMKAIMEEAKKRVIPEPKPIESETLSTLEEAEQILNET